MLTQTALLPTPPLALATATSAPTSGSFRTAAAPFSALALVGVLSGRASQKILVVNYTFPGRYRPGVPKFARRIRSPFGTTEDHHIVLSHTVRELECP
jgi:hypothetical protein